MDPKQFIHSTESSQVGNEDTKALAKAIADKIKEGDEKTKALCTSPRIYRVPEDLRNLKPSAYIPRLITIGPLHRNDEHLQTPMQHVKMHYTDQLFHRVAKAKGIEDKRNIREIKGEVMQNCVAKMKKCSNRAKSYYAEVPLVHKAKTKSYYAKEVSLEDKAKSYHIEEVPLVDKAKKHDPEEANDSEMVEMMLVDGCFILELLRSSHHIKSKAARKMTASGGDGGNSKASCSSPQPSNGGEDDSQSCSCSLDEMVYIDPILDIILTKIIVKHDLLLLENQIPFFVLEELFKLTVHQIPEDQNKPSLTDYVLSYFCDIMCPYGDNSEGQNSEKKTSCSPSDCVIWVKKMSSNCFGKEVSGKAKVYLPKKKKGYYHILHFLHDHYVRAGGKSEVATGVPHASPCHTPPLEEPAGELEVAEGVPHASTCHTPLLGEPAGEREVPSCLSWQCCHSTPPLGEPKGKKFTELEVFASDLKYAGVKFLPSKETNLFDVKFEEPKGPFRWFRSATFEIPTLNIHDLTEPFLRNLIALEQCCPRVDRYFTSYAKFMDMLIDSNDDVKVLTKARVIRNHLGADMDVCDLFNKLCKEVVTPVDSIFNDKCQEAYLYSQHRWPKWWAYWKRTYIETPWGIVAFFLAIIAFGITVTDFVRGFFE